MEAEGKIFDEAGPEGLGEYVPAVYARNVDEAERYRQLLEDHDVPATIDEDYRPPRPAQAKAEQASVAVLVPESLLEDAKAYIADMEEMNDLVEDEDYLDEEDDDFEDEEDLEFDDEDEEL